MNVLIGNWFIENNDILTVCTLIYYNGTIYHYIYFKWGKKVKDFELIFVYLKITSKKLFFKLNKELIIKLEHSKNT